ncbi:fimbrial protein [Citrobacter sp. BDA59-3]|uniref:fimbrial protein n=1 Tax=Citrobacter sp. BDA59-3 TaxID=2781952 RepID=UPI0018825BD6|nr:fimbrial protein [Citrobacter sp. BDA59-3]QOV67011.1 fimbrial protein [Citrobacter sp. BDA59-3]
MKRMMSVLWRLLFCCLIGFGLMNYAYAYVCYNGSQSVGNGSATFTVMVNPVALNKSLTDTILTSMNSYASCYGAPGPNSKDALRVNSLEITDSRLTDLGYRAYIIDASNQKTAAPAANVCLWPDASCTISSEVSITRPINAQIGIDRASGSGNWNTAKTIPANTKIMTMKTQMRINGGWDSRAIITWNFYLNADMVAPAYTCLISQYDSTVTLPSVARSDIVSHGAGRYPNAKKAFKFNLACDEQTRVSVTFDGDTLSGTGTDSVLKNKLSGNDNVGVQLLFNDSTPVKMAEKLEVAGSAQATELLSFNAYYYYKGGDISGGPVKANTTFTFEYQ